MPSWIAYTKPLRSICSRKHQIKLWCFSVYLKYFYPFLKQKLSKINSDFFLSSCIVKSYLFDFPKYLLNHHFIFTAIEDVLILFYVESFNSLVFILSPSNAILISLSDSHYKTAILCYYSLTYFNTAAMLTRKIKLHYMAHSTFKYIITLLKFLLFVACLQTCHFF